MHRHLLRSLILSAVISLLTTGCILSQSVDRAYIGTYKTSPTYHNHRVTGYILLPIAFAADIVTFPLQAVLLMIFGDDFPFENERYAELNHDRRFQNLTAEQKSVALAEFRSLVRAGAVSENSGLVICEDGHVVVVNLNPEARAKLIARANAAAPEGLSRAH